MLTVGGVDPCPLTVYTTHSNQPQMNFATATPEQLTAAGFKFKTVRPRRPRKGELICEQVKFSTKRGSQQWRDRAHISSPSAYAVVMGNG